MILFRNVLLMAAFFTINALDAKGGKSASVQRRQPTPTKSPAVPMGKNQTPKSTGGENIGGTGELPSYFTRFITEFKSPIITANNMIDMMWVKGAVQALAHDHMLGDLMNPSVFRLTVGMLWYAIEGQTNYRAKLAQNRNNLWQSLERNLDEIRRMPSKPSQQSQQTNLVNAGLQGLRNFRAQTSATIKTNPSYFISDSDSFVQQAWLEQALSIVLSNNQIPLTAQNKDAIQKELVETVYALMMEIVRTEVKTPSVQQNNNVLQKAKDQVEQFMNAQLSTSAGGLQPMVNAPIRPALKELTDVKAPLSPRSAQEKEDRKKWIDDLLSVPMPKD